MLGNKTRAYADIEQNVKGLIEGQVVCLDPSIGSSSSMPGWAVYRAGGLVSSGIFEISPKNSIPDRLRAVYNCMRRLYDQYPPDVLVYEDVPAQRQGGGNAVAHASLLKASGVILCVPGPTGHVGLMPVSWKAEARESYRKSDVNDAIELGYVAIQVAMRIRDMSPKRKRK